MDLVEVRDTCGLFVIEADGFTEDDIITVFDPCGLSDSVVDIFAEPEEVAVAELVLLIFVVGESVNDAIAVFVAPTLVVAEADPDEVFDIEEDAVTVNEGGLVFDPFGLTDSDRDIRAEMLDEAVPVGVRVGRELELTAAVLVDVFVLLLEEVAEEELVVDLESGVEAVAEGLGLMDSEARLECVAVLVVVVVMEGRIPRLARSRFRV